MLSNHEIILLSIGGLLLIWAFLARRSWFDAALIFLTALAAFYLAATSLLHLNQAFIIPQLVLGVLGLIMLARSFLTPLGTGHKLAFRLGGCAVMIPLLLLIAVIAFFAMGSGHDRRPANSASSNVASSNVASSNAASPNVASSNTPSSNSTSPNGASPSRP
jgi:hypothetical protein